MGRSDWLRECSAVCVWTGGVRISYIRGVLIQSFGLFFRQVSVNWIITTDGMALVEGRAGITFGVELYVPWDAPEAVMDIHSADVVPLGSIPDVIGITGRRPDAAGKSSSSGKRCS